MTLLDATKRASCVSFARRPSGSSPSLLVVGLLLLAETEQLWARLPSWTAQD